jgi:adenosylmethionine-8-amino-7-oxononanoate aminotransferase
MHGHTYSGHPVACAAALEVQRIIAEENLLANVRAVGEHLEHRLIERFGAHAYVGDIRGRGLFRAIELVEYRDGKKPFAPERRLHAAIKDKAFERGLACYALGGTADGRAGDHVLLAPAYTATKSDIDRIVDILGTAVDAVLDE